MHVPQLKQYEYTRQKNNMTCAWETLKSTHEILVLIAYALMYLINANADVSSKAIGILFCMSIQLYPYFVHANSEGSGASPHMHRRARAFSILRDFKNAPFYILCFFHMIDLRMFSVSFFILLQNGPFFAIISICSCCLF